MNHFINIKWLSHPLSSQALGFGIVDFTLHHPQVTPAGKKKMKKRNKTKKNHKTTAKKNPKPESSFLDILHQDMKTKGLAVTTPTWVIVWGGVLLKSMFLLKETELRFSSPKARLVERRTWLHGLEHGHWTRAHGTKSRMSSIFINKVLFKDTHAHSFTCYLWLLLHCIINWAVVMETKWPAKPKNIYHLGL